jgi:hypothetical protein
VTSIPAGQETSSEAGTDGGSDGGHVCLALGCDPACPNGTLKDSYGCDTCQCAPADEGGAADADAADGGATTGFRWYATCGYPVCGVATLDGGAASHDAGEVNDAGQPCPSAGSPCGVIGETCGTPSQANCGVTLVCASQDPKGGLGGCPVSSRQYKDGISYVDETELRHLHDEALAMRLATYTYKPRVADPGHTHLGFIIEDNLQTPAVDATHDRVDMYGYVSMVVAAMQVQEKEIAALRSDLDAARRDLASCKAPDAKLRSKGR